MEIHMKLDIIKPLKSKHPLLLYGLVAFVSFILTGQLHILMGNCII